MELFAIFIGVSFGIPMKFFIDRFLNRRAIDRRKQRGGYIYFYMNPVSCIPVIKIGRAKTAGQRLKAQRTPLAFGMKVAGVVMVRSDVVAEAYIHKKFAYSRVHDDKRNEWFYLTPATIWFILTVRDMDITRKVRHELSNKRRHSKS